MAESPAPLAEAVKEGRLAGLRALRASLVASIEADDGKQVAPLARQLRETLREIDELERAAGRKGSLVDELADRRKGGKPDAARVTPAGGRRKNVGS